MVGQAVLRECLVDEGVTRVVTLGRRATGQRHEKLREVVHDDLMDLSPVEAQLSGLDACFFCIGVTSAGMTEASYTKVTYDLTVAVATTLARHNPAMTFIFVSGAGTDSTERGRVMWARVKGRAENALLRMPFRAAYMFRPALILPLHGIRSRTRAYRIFYSVVKPVNRLLKALFPGSVTTTEQLGRAMLAVARRGYPRPILESRDISSF
jgi:uncharacterized protein YbjT (DUF2867 family)